MKIMIIDDSSITRTMLREMFESSGHTVVAELDSFSEALAQYREHTPDLTTLDLSLVGDKTGFDVLKALRAFDRNARVMVVSGNTQKRAQESLRLAGACAFLPKPFDLDDLKAALKTLSLP
jgi:two-component system chemotaxis response regulator CheY